MKQVLKTIRKARFAAEAGSNKKAAELLRIAADQLKRLDL